MNLTMKAIGFLWPVLCATEMLSAQQALLPSGGDIYSSSGSISYSIGQVAFSHIEGEAGSLNQGVQQPHTFAIVGLEDLQKETSVRLYPNPADQFVNIQFSTPMETSNHFSARLYDMKGNLVKEQILDDNINTVPLTNLSDATYVLQIWNHHTHLKSFALIKSN